MLSEARRPIEATGIEVRCNRGLSISWWIGPSYRHRLERVAALLSINRIAFSAVHSSDQMQEGYPTLQVGSGIFSFLPGISAGL